MRKIFATAFLALLLAGCSSDEEPARQDAIDRSVIYGETLVFEAGGYVCDNPFVGELREGENGAQTFVAAHIGECEIYNSSIANARYRITVEPEETVFPNLHMEIGMPYAEFVKAHFQYLRNPGNPIVANATDDASDHIRYAYHFSDDRLARIVVTFNVSDLGNGGEKKLDDFLTHRYEEDADAPGTWYNAYSPGEATVKATLEGPDYRSILTIESVR